MSTMMYGWASEAPAPVAPRVRTPLVRVYLAIFCAAGALLAGAPARGELSNPEESPRDPIASLLTLPGDWVEVRFTPGSLDRAARLQGRLGDLFRRFNAWSKGSRALEVLVVSPDEWARLQIELPFGFPAKKDQDSWYAPAWGTEGSVQLWKGLAASEVEGIEQFQVRGSPKEIASLALADFVLELEICRSFMSSEAVAGGVEGLWLSDLFAHVLCTSSDRLRTYQDPVGSAALLQALAVAEGAPTRLKLSDYGPDLDFAAWLGFQARFAQGAELIWAETGKASVKRILRMRRKKGSALVFEDLLREYPNLSQWHPGAS